MLGQRHSPLLNQCRSIVYDAGPTLIHNWVCCKLCANTWHSSNAVSMLTHSLRRWPDIKTALVMFTDCCIVIRVTLSIPASKTPDNTIHWPNADVMLDHRLRCQANIIPPKTLQALITIFYHECIFSEHFLKTKVLNLWTSNVIFDKFIRTGVQHLAVSGLTVRLPVADSWIDEDGCTAMSTVSHTQHPSSP